MATELLGYARLIADYNLNALPLMEYSLIDSAVKGRDRRAKNGQTVLHFSSHYAHDNSLTGHLHFIDLASRRLNQNLSKVKPFSFTHWFVPRLTPILMVTKWRYTYR